jgi:hypothetical protein
MMGESESDEECDGICEEDSPEFIGPRLPPIRYVTFRSKSDRIKILNDTYLKDRVDSIFESVLLSDPL